jgi:hypothetical protein
MNAPYQKNAPNQKKAPYQNRRHIHLVDHVLQKALLVALVVMETAAVAIAIWVLYRALGAIVDENVYRIHFTGGASMLALLLSEGMRVLAGILALNLLAVFIADRIWGYYVNGIVRNLDHLMAASGRLDFSAGEPIFFHHAVLDQALAWRSAEHARLARMRERIRRLPAQLPATPEDRAALATVLATLQDD